MFCFRHVISLWWFKTKHYLYSSCNVRKTWWVNQVIFTYWSGTFIKGSKVNKVSQLITCFCYIILELGKSCGQTSSVLARRLYSHGGKQAARDEAGSQTGWYSIVLSKRIHWYLHFPNPFHSIPQADINMKLQVHRSSIHAYLPPLHRSALVEP